MKIVLAKIPLLRIFGMGTHADHNWVAAIQGTDIGFIADTVYEAVGVLVRATLATNWREDGEWLRRKEELIALFPPPGPGFSQLEAELGKYCIDHGYQLEMYFAVEGGEGEVGYRPLESSDLI